MTLAWLPFVLGRNIYPDGHSRLKNGGKYGTVGRNKKEGISVVLILVYAGLFMSMRTGLGNGTPR